MTPAGLTALPIFCWSLIKALLPFPTPSVLALAGAAIEAPDGRWGTLVGRMIWRVAIPGGAGMTLGSIPYYAWARRHGRPTLERFLRRRPKWRALAERCERAIARRPTLSNVLMRALPVIPLALGSLLLGLSECGWADFAAWTFVGGLVRAGVLAGGGHFARAALSTASLPGGVTVWLEGGVAAIALIATVLSLSAGRSSSS